MFLQQKLSFKIFLRILVVLLIGQLIYGLVYYRDVVKEKRQQMSTRAELIRRIVQDRFNSICKVGIMALDSLVGNSEVREALYLRERNRLLLLTLPVWRKLKKSGIAQFQFHIPPAISFLRLHKINKYGDDLSKFRKTVVVCNAERRPVIGFERGRAGWGYRIVVPVKYEGMHAGSVELGIKVGESLLEEFKNVEGGRWAIFSFLDIDKDGNVVDLDHPKLVAATDEDIAEHDPWYFKSEIFERLKRGETVWKWHKDDDDVEIVVPVKDYAGRAALAFVNMKHAGFKEAIFAVIAKTVVISLILLIVMAVVSLWYISKNLSPIAKITEMINEIAKGEGDLTKHLDIRSDDEIGELAKGFNEFIDKQHKMISDIKNSVEDLLVNMNSLNEKSFDIDETSRDQSDHINRVATAVEEMNSTVAEIANNADAVAQQADEALNKASEGNSIVQQTIGGMERISQAVEKASYRINSLGEKSAQIGEIISVIDDIADQTNLLALNAAIEAARAGEQGRGFAVVADEVRKLAERTSQATKEVAETIKTIQEETEYAVRAMEESKQEVDQGKELAASSGNALKEIDAAVSSVATMINQIANATREQSKATEEITQSIEEITVLANKVSDIATQSRHVVEKLTNLAGEIKSQVDRFKL